MKSRQFQNVEHSGRLFKKVNNVKNEQKKAVNCSRLKDLKATQTNAVHEASLDTGFFKRLYNKAFGRQLGNCEYIFQNKELLFIFFSERNMSIYDIILSTFL